VNKIINVYTLFKYNHKAYKFKTTDMLKESENFVIENFNLKDQLSQANSKIENLHNTFSNIFYYFFLFIYLLIFY